MAKTISIDDGKNHYSQCKLKNITIILRAVANSFLANTKNEMNKIKKAYNNVYSA